MLHQGGGVFSKILKLYGISISSLLLMESLKCCALGSSWCWFGIYDLFLRLWFLHAYVLLCLLAPFINVVVDSAECLKIVVPFCLTILIWGFVCELPVINRWFIKTSGIESFSGLTLAAVYAIGRVYKVMRLQERIQMRWVLGALPILLCIACVGFNNPKDGTWVSGWLGNYVSPFAVAISVCFLYVCNCMRFPKWMLSLAMFISPSMFSVYVMHQHPIWWSWMKDVGRMLIEAHIDWAVIFGLSVIIFFGCVACDFVRRGLLCGVKRLRAHNDAE